MCPKVIKHKHCLPGVSMPFVTKISMSTLSLGFTHFLTTHTCNWWCTIKQSPSLGRPNSHQTWPSWSTHAFTDSLRFYWKAIYAVGGLSDMNLLPFLKWSPPSVMSCSSNPQPEQLKHKRTLQGPTSQPCARACGHWLTCAFKSFNTFVQTLHRVNNFIITAGPALGQ